MLNDRLRIALERESAETWNWLWKRLVAYACILLRSRRWRLAGDGVVPGGYDAESIVQDAFEQLFAGSDWEPSGDPYSQDELRFELMRLVRNAVRNLERRKENFLLLNEPDLSAKDDDNRPSGFFETVPADYPSEDATMLRNEAYVRLERFKAEFNAFLGDNDLVKGIFDCICKDVVKRSEQAETLGITAQEVTNGRKKLERKLDAFAQQYPDYPMVFITEVKNA